MYSLRRQREYFMNTALRDEYKRIRRKPRRLRRKPRRQPRRRGPSQEVDTTYSRVFTRIPAVFACSAHVFRGGVFRVVFKVFEMYSKPYSSNTKMGLVALESQMYSALYLACIHGDDVLMDTNANTCEYTRILANTCI